LLTSLDLPENLSAISIEAFAQCCNLTISKAPSFQYHFFDNNFRGLQGKLIESGFSLDNPNDAMQGQRTTHTLEGASSSTVYTGMAHSSDMCYNWNVWARVKDGDGRLPLFTAAARSLKWSYLRLIFNANMPVVNEIDVLTGLPLFMLDATGPTSDIESIYNLLKECPAAISIINNKRDNSSTDSRRKRVCEFSQDNISKIHKT